MEFDPSGRGVEFTPAKLVLGEVLKNIQKLKNGDVLHIGNASEIIRVGDKNIFVDGAIAGTSFLEPQRVLPPGPFKQDFLKSSKDESTFTHFMIDAPPESPDDKSSQISRIGRALAPHIDVMLTSHLHADHIDFEITRTILENNPKALAYGPLSWKKFILRHHGREFADPNGKPVLPDAILERIRSFIPRRTDMEKPKSRRWYRPLVPTEVTLDKKLRITSIDVPHLGSQEVVEMTQGFLLESGAERMLVIADAGVSPEVITQIQRYHQEKPLTHIVMSVGVFNPDAMHGIVPAQITRVYRDWVEEGFLHSAFLPVIAEAVTDGKVPITCVHHGFYYNFSPDRKYINFRLPAQPPGKETADHWLGRLRTYITELMEVNRDRIDDLDRMSLAYNHNRSKFRKDALFRLTFSGSLVNWIKREKVPQPVLDHLGMPQPGEIIKKSLR